MCEGQKVHSVASPLKKALEWFNDCSNFTFTNSSLIDAAKMYCDISVSIMVLELDGNSEHVAHG